MSGVQKDLLSQIDQVYFWWLFTHIQNITTIYKLIYKRYKHNIKKVMEAWFDYIVPVTLS